MIHPMMLRRSAIRASGHAHNALGAIAASFPRSSTTTTSTATTTSTSSRRGVATSMGAPQVATAISKPTLANIEKRWEDMPPPEQAELWMALRDRMKGDWAELTMQEKRAGYWIAFGPHGPRKGPDPGEGMYVFSRVCLGIAVAIGLFGLIRMVAPPAPASMSKEWQEASNEYLKSQRSDPLTGLSSPGYSGPGMVQSPPKKN